MTVGAAARVSRVTVAPGPYAATVTARPPTATLVAVGVGGVLGGLAREALTLAWPGGTLPWAVLVINVVGAFVLGVVVEVVVGRGWATASGRLPRLARPFLGTGVCGGFTTFSSLAVALDEGVRDARPGAALAYLGLSLVLGLAAVVAGSAAGRRVAR